MNIQEYLKVSKAELKQKNLKLTETKKCLGMWRYAREHAHLESLIHELWLLSCAMARYEWGDETTLDDFSVEGKVVARNGKKEIEL